MKSGVGMVKIIMPAGVEMEVIAFISFSEKSDDEFVKLFEKRKELIK